MADTAGALQSSQLLTESLSWRRLLFAFLVVISSIALLALMAAALFLPAGWDGWGVVMLTMFAFTLPWTTIGFWNAVIGFLIMALSRDPEGLVAPFSRTVNHDATIDSKTAICICTRNEDTARLSRNLSWMLERLVETGEGQWFHLYILSDSNESTTVDAEQSLAQDLAARFSRQVEVHYRQRLNGEGFKAGNLRDFLERWGHQYAYLIVLDADSLMSPAVMLRLVRTMQAHPEIGILQTLVTALPTRSAFARVFQFGMRLGMRSWTLGAAWWQGDCGPYWGHNAILRVKPFTEHCKLPLIPGAPPLGGHVLSHDQLEAVLMRRAGYEVRVLPEEGGSWEENPPHLLEFIRRDLRWCQGNMQYFHFVKMPGLLMVSRYQLWLAIAMYLSGPGWMGFTLFAMIRHGPLDTTLGLILLSASLVMGFAPKLATLANVLVRARSRQAFGGTSRILVGTLIETVFAMLIAPAVALSVTLFVLALPFGKRITWDAQQRDTEGIPPYLALNRLWPHLLTGVVLLASLYWMAPSALALAAPLYLGLIGAPALTVISGSPGLGNWARIVGLCLLPEENPKLQHASLPLDIR